MALEREKPRTIDISCLAGERLPNMGSDTSGSMHSNAFGLSVTGRVRFRYQICFNGTVASSSATSA